MKKLVKKNKKPLLKMVLVTLCGFFFSLGYSQPEPPGVSIEIVDIEGLDHVRLSWERVEDAEAYNIYSSYDPYTDDWGEPEATVGDSVFVYTAELDELRRRYYMVTAYQVDEAAQPPEMIFVQGGNLGDIEVASFNISKHLISQRRYASIMANSPQDAEPSHFEDNPENPVEMISWFDAVEYCNRLSMRENLIPVYSYLNMGTDPDNWPEGWNSIWSNHANIRMEGDDERYGYRLPNEHQWEYAARGGRVAQNANPPTFNDRWAGTDTEAQLADFAWYQVNSNGRTHPVGTKRPNEIEIKDMSGNVMEWMENVEDEIIPGFFGAIARGGGWDSNAANCNVQTARYLFFMGGAAATRNNVGFRVVRTTR